jgi:hypothetical protein
VIIGLPRPGERFPKRIAYCDLLHVTRIEPSNGDRDNPEEASRS